MIFSLLLAGLTISLPPRADVGGTQLTLGDIATIEGDAAQVELLQGLDLGYSPAPGYSRLFDRQSLAVQVKKLSPSLAITWAGADQCRVYPETQMVTGKRLVDVARAELDRLFSGQDVEIELERGAGELTVPMGRSPLRLTPVLQRRSPRGGTWSIPVQVWVDGEVYQTVWTSWKVAYWQTRSVLKQPVPRGTQLEPALFEKRRVRVYGSANQAPLAPEVLDAAVALRDLPAGVAVGVHDVERPQVIRRGDRVSLEVQRGAITARTWVVAMGSGRMGDRITVSTASGKRELQAFIVSSELVRLQLQ